MRRKGYEVESGPATLRLLTEAHLDPKSAAAGAPNAGLRETIVPMLLKEDVEMTVRRPPTLTEAADAQSARLIWIAGEIERTAASREPANDNTDPPLPPVLAARWPRVFPGL
jgi:hypothetical protein